MLMIKNRPIRNIITENILNCSIEIKGIGIVRAKYKEIKELFTEKSVLNFWIIINFLIW